jgi:hypothetical protein
LQRYPLLAAEFPLLAGEITRKQTYPRPKAIALIKKIHASSDAYETGIAISAARSSSGKAGEAAEEFLRVSEE